MLLKLLFSFFWLAWCYRLLVYSVEMIGVDKAAKTSKYSVEELLNTVFPTKVSSDFDLDPCKAGKTIHFTQII